MANVVRVAPRLAPAPLEKCPRCGSAKIEMRPDGAFLCGDCYHTTKRRSSPSLLQSWSHSIFNVEREGPPDAELVFAGRVAGVGGFLFLAGIVFALGWIPVSGLLQRLLAPTPPSELALIGGVVIVGALGLLSLFAGYTMSRGDPKAWRAALPIGLIGLILGILGPGGALGIVGGGLVAAGGYLGRVGEM